MGSFTTRLTWPQEEVLDTIKACVPPEAGLHTAVAWPYSTDLIKVVLVAPKFDREWFVNLPRCAQYSVTSMCSDTTVVEFTALVTRFRKQLEARKPPQSRWNVTVSERSDDLHNLIFGQVGVGVFNTCEYTAEGLSFLATSDKDLDNAISEGLLAGKQAGWVVSYTKETFQP